MVQVIFNYTFLNKLYDFNEKLIESKSIYSYYDSDTDLLAVHQYHMARILIELGYIGFEALVCDNFYFVDKNIFDFRANFEQMKETITNVSKNKKEYLDLKPLVIETDVSFESLLNIKICYNNKKNYIKALFSRNTTIKRLDDFYRDFFLFSYEYDDKRSPYDQDNNKLELDSRAKQDMFIQFRTDDLNNNHMYN